MRRASGAALAVAALTVAGCGRPRVSDTGTAEVHEESGILGFDVEPGFLSSRVLPDASDEGRFELPVFEPARAFDRIGLTWDSIDAGGAANLEVRIDSGEWVPVVVDFSESVPDSGLTLHAGHVDVPQGGSLVASRVALSRAFATEGKTASPELTALHLEVFSADEVAETNATEPIDGGAPADATSTASAVAAPSIVARSSWGARSPKCEGTSHSPYRMTFHHTETSNGESGDTAKARMRQMQAFHQDVRGWCDIGYHFSVDWAGQVYQGRDTTDRTASHVGGQNTGNIGISLMGSFEGATTPGSAQLAGLEKIFAYEASKYGITVDDTHVKGHRQWPGQTTSCPGTNLLAKKADILTAVKNILAGGTTDGGDTRPTVIVDNKDAGFHASSNWWASTNQPDRYGANYMVRNTGSLSDPASWDANLAGGKYEVFVWYSQGTDRPTGAPYFVEHSAGSTKVLVNEMTNGGRWMSLGTYTFASGTAERVVLSCWTDTGAHVIADAVKFVPR